MSAFTKGLRNARPGLLVLAATIAATIAAAIGAACANVTAPEGGPEDRDPPVVAKITPANGAVGIKPKDVVIQFNEVISETPRGAQELKSLVFISPKSGEPVVDWQRSRIVIRTKKGWKPNTVYSVTVSPGIVDLRGNQLDSAIRLVFSTGGQIPDTRITGVVFDWILGKGSPKALVEAIAPDSTTYQVLADSVGKYELRHMPPGKYLVRAYMDRNVNRSLDPSEAWDTATVALTASGQSDLYMFPHDTVGVRISEMTLQDSGRVLKITLDKPYLPTQLVTPQTVSIKKADSSLVLLSLVESGSEHVWRDSVRRAIADSITRSKSLDTTKAGRARADSVAKQRRLDSLVTADRADREARRLALLRGGRPLPKRDTTPPPKMQRPIVYSELYATLAEPLAPASQFRVSARNIRSLSGTERSPSRTLTTPKAEKRDTTAAKRDTAAVKRP